MDKMGSAPDRLNIPYLMQIYIAGCVLNRNEKMFRCINL